jgi:hypothetical protein
VHFCRHLDKRNQSSLHTIGTTGNEAWSNGQWSLTYQVKGGDPVEHTGYWLEIYSLEGGTWKKRVDAWKVHPGTGSEDDAILNARQTMKICLVVALVGFAIGLLGLNQ